MCHAILAEVASNVLTKDLATVTVHWFGRTVTFELVFSSHSLVTIDVK